VFQAAAKAAAVPLVIIGVSAARWCAYFYVRVMVAISSRATRAGKCRHAQLLE